jgi:hypothetical protein
MKPAVTLLAAVLVASSFTFCSFEAAASAARVAFERTLAVYVDDAYVPQLGSFTRAPHPLVWLTDVAMTRVACSG